MHAPQHRSRKSCDRTCAHDVRNDHQQLAAEAVGRDAREQAEEPERHETREADETGPGRRVREREDEQRVRDRRRLRTRCGEQLSGLKQDEVAVAPERRRPHANAQRTANRNVCESSAARVSPRVRAKRTEVLPLPTALNRSQTV